MQERQLVGEKVPTVTIGMPVYNGSRYLRQTLDNLLEQNYQDFELIIADNASTDETREIALEYAAKDKRIKYDCAEENRGARWNFNRVCKMASGDLFMWASCHDKWDPTLIAEFVEILEHDSSVVLCFSEAAEIDEYDNRIGPLRGKIDTRGMRRGARYMKVVSSGCCYAIYGMFRTSSLRQVLRSKDSLGPDALALAELSFLGAFAFVPKELFFLRRMSVSRNFRRYFDNLNLKLTLWNCFRLYGMYIGDYLAIVRKHAHGLTQRIGLSTWTVIVLLWRTLLWGIGIIISFFWPKFYRPL